MMAGCSCLLAKSRAFLGARKKRQIFPSLSSKFILYRQHFRKMIQRDYLIVGAGIGGASACEGIRKYDKRGSVTLTALEEFSAGQIGRSEKAGGARRTLVSRT